MKLARRTVLFGALAKALAQEQPTFSADVKLVSLLATVHDKDGRAVKGLTVDDFVLREDGVLQKIRYFSQEASLPLTIGLLVDTSRSQTGVLEQERRASLTFLNRVLRPDQDRAFVAHFDYRAETVQGLTSSTADLASALQKLSVPDAYGTMIFTSIRDCANQVMRHQSGRKAFILLTDGVGYHDSTSISTAIEFAQRADTILYPIRFADSIKVYRPVRAAILAQASAHGKEGLARMARETGGASFEASRKLSIEPIYTQIEDLLRHQYSIGYTPERLEDAPGAYHKIVLTTRDRKLVVKTRDGYYTK
jgi:VWFA-related protein